MVEVNQAVDRIRESAGAAPCLDRHCFAAGLRVEDPLQP
jgi:hypothetical protein